MFPDVVGTPVGTTCMEIMSSCEKLAVPVQLAVVAEPEIVTVAAEADPAFMMLNVQPVAPPGAVVTHTVSFLMLIASDRNVPALSPKLPWVSAPFQALYKVLVMNA